MGIAEILGSDLARDEFHSGAASGWHGASAPAFRDASAPGFHASSALADAAVISLDAYERPQDTEVLLFPLVTVDELKYPGALVSPVSAPGFAPPGMIAFPPSGSGSGSIAGDGEIDGWTADLIAGQTYTFAVYGSGVTPLEDTAFFLHDPADVFISLDDDGGAGESSLLTYTATATGKYNFYITNAGSGLSGDYTFDIAGYPGGDVAGASFATAEVLTFGGVTYGYIDGGPTNDFSEIDLFAFSGIAGQIYSFEVAGGADYASNPDNLPFGEIDPRIAIFDSNGNQLAFDDDILFPSDVSSKLAFAPDTSGTYYLYVDAYWNFTTGNPQFGGFSITMENPDPASFDPLESLLWDSAANVPFDGSSTAYVYFAPAGVNFGETADDGVSPMITYGWNQYEIDQMMLALEEYEKILGVNYQITNDPNAATFRLMTTESSLYGAYFYPQDPAYGTQQGIGVFNVLSGGWNQDQQQTLEQGGFSFAVILHEFGHAHGLSHPHDTGGGSEIMLGVGAPTDSFGLYDLNQGVYTVMSYNDAWQLHPDGPSPYTLADIDHGWSGTLSAFDIAALQLRYGVINPHNTGDDTYTLTGVNAPGTYYETIWDTGGVDTIAYGGALDAQIDLLAATLDYSPTGGGAISFVDNIWGGYSIANGVVIENATGGSGDDLLLGNDQGNILTGNDGADTLLGRGGGDQQFGGLGADYLDGGVGDDSLFGDGDSDILIFDAAEFDSLTGGAGDDGFYSLDGIVENVLIYDFAVGDSIVALGANYDGATFSGSYDGARTTVQFDIGDGGAPEGFFYLNGDRTSSISGFQASFDGANTAITLVLTDDYAGDTGTTGVINPDSDGDSVTGFVETPGDEDWFKTTLTAGFTYNFDLTGTFTGGGDLSDPFLRIYDAGGSEIVSNDDYFTGGGGGIFVTLESFIQYTATATGTYYVSAGAFASNTGTYTLTGTDFGPLSPGEIVGSPFADIADGTLDSEFIRGLAGDDTITAGGGDDYIEGGRGDDSMDGGEGDDFFALGAGFNDSVGGDDGVDTIVGGAGADTVYGSYQDLNGDLLADFSSGGIGLYVYDAIISSSSFTATFDGANTFIEFDIGDGGGADGLFSVNGDWTGSLADIQAASDGFGTYIFYNPGDDFGSEQGNSGLLDPGPLPDGASATGVIEVSGDRDWFATTLTAGVTYNFEIRGDASGLGTLFDTYLRIHDSSGVEVAYNDDHFADAALTEFVTFESFVQFTPTTSGTYYIGASAFSSGTGDYTVTATDLGVLSADQQYGGVFTDSLEGGAADDDLSGLGGGDSLFGFDGMDTLAGGAGDDYVSPGAGEDSSDGGDGFDAIDYSNYAAAGVFDLAGGTATLAGLYTETMLNFEKIITTLANDLVDGTTGDDWIQTEGGDDTIKGSAGDDSLFAGFGDDRVEGAGGDDYIKGGPGKDTLNGGGDDDTIGGSNRSDLIRGEAGRDLLLGSNGNDRLFGGFAADTLLGGNGRDTLWGGGQADRLVGGGNVDTASYSDALDGVWVRLWAGDGVLGDADGDVLIGMENLIGSDFADTLQGDDNANRILGGAGDDILQALDGDDTLSGDAGDDVLVGGAGNDVFLMFGASLGDDVITDFTAGPGVGDVIQLFGFGAAFDTFAEIQAAASQVGADAVIDFGAAGSLTLVGVTVASLNADDFVF